MGNNVSNKKEMDKYLPDAATLEYYAFTSGLYVTSGNCA